MLERETIFPLTLGLLLALAAHLGAAAGYVAARHRAASHTAASTMPDLIVADLLVTEPRHARRPAVISATIANRGKPIDSPVTVVCFVDDREIGRKLAVANPGRAAFDYTAQQPGVQTVKIVVDPDDKIAESDEDNNQRQAPYIWLEPPSNDPTKKPAGPQAPPDLTVAGIDVSKPRVAGDPATLSIGVGNLGGSLRQPTTVRVMLDGQEIDMLRLDPPLAGGSITPLSRTIKVDQPGEHEIRVTVDPDNAVYESRENNNDKSAKFVWVDPEQAVKIGQEKPSPVEINWISYEDYQALLARKSKFDQAALQRSATPDPNARAMPLDPTEPVARTPAAQPQPTPPSPQKQPMTTAAQAVVQPDLQPAQPAQPIKPLDPQTKPAQVAPTLARSETPQAAAPKQAEAKAPSAPKSTSTTPADTASNAPKPQPRNPESRPLALSTIRLPEQPGAKAVAPQPIPQAKASPTTAAPPSPAVAPMPQSPQAKPELRSAPPTLAALPITPKPDAPAGAPAMKQPPPQAPDERKTQTPDKPVDPAAKPTDGQQPQPTPKPTQTPQPSQTRPVTTPSMPRDAKPTAAPRDPMREAPPVTRIENLKIQPGRVVSQQGLQINTVTPRIAPVALYSSAPVNPDVIVVFNRAGEVVKAEIVKSTGYMNIDAPILQSLYKWSAQGELLSRVPETLTLQVHILLTDE
jgi:hypothetical protein